MVDTQGTDPTALEAADELYEAAQMALYKGPARSPEGIRTTAHAEWAQPLAAALLRCRRTRKKEGR